MNYLAQVLQVLPGDGFTVYIWFSDGSVRLLDVKPLIEKGGVFSQLADESTFARALTVMNHAVAWDIEGTRNAADVIDLDPVSSYERSVLVDDPLSCVA